MCSNCGFPVVQGHWTDAGGADAGDRLRARFKRARILNAVLRPFGMAAHDSIAISGMQISTLTGAHVLVGDFSEVWNAVETMRGVPFDPLDPKFTHAPGD
jgi:hypothetical protein